MPKLVVTAIKISLVWLTFPILNSLVQLLHSSQACMLTSKLVARHITCVTMVEVAQQVMASFVQMAHYLTKKNLNVIIGITWIAQLKPNFMN